MASSVVKAAANLARRASHNVAHRSRVHALTAYEQHAGVTQFWRPFSTVGHGSGGREGSPNIIPPPASLPFSVMGLNHIAIAVPDLKAAAEHYRTMFGATVSEPHDLPEHGVSVVIAQIHNATIELLHPLGAGSPIQKFLDKNPRGGLHHLCFTVDNIDAASKYVSAEGVRVLGDGRPKIGAHNNPVLFLDPRDNGGVLCELEQVSCAEPAAHK